MRFFRWHNRWAGENLATTSYTHVAMKHMASDNKTRKTVDHTLADHTKFASLEHQTVETIEPIVTQPYYVYVCTVKRMYIAIGFKFF
jgi:hypothetical protein